MVCQENSFALKENLGNWLVRFVDEIDYLGKAAFQREHLIGCTLTKFGNVYYFQENILLGKCTVRACFSKKSCLCGIDLLSTNVMQTWLLCTAELSKNPRTL